MSPWVKKKDFLSHVEENRTQFIELKTVFKDHDQNVEAKHEENLAALGQIRATQVTTQGKLDDILTLRPAIEAGLLADQKAEARKKDIEYRKKLFRRVFLAVVTTATTVGGLIPLIQWLSSLHFHLGISS